MFIIFLFSCSQRHRIGRVNTKATKGMVVLILNYCAMGDTRVLRFRGPDPDPDPDPGRDRVV